MQIDPSELLWDTNESAPSKPSLAEARTELTARLNEKIVYILQIHNYPVGFEGIKIPTVSETDLEVGKEGNILHLSEKARTRVLQEIQRNLEEKYTEEAINGTIEALKSKKVQLQEELEQIPPQIRNIRVFKPFWAKEQRDIDGFELRQSALPLEISQCEEEINYRQLIKSDSPELVSAIVLELLPAILDETATFEEPVAKKTHAWIPATPTEFFHVNALPSPLESRKTRTTGFRIAALAALITLGGGGAYLLREQSANKAHAESLENEHWKNILRCLERHPNVVEWLWNDAAKKLSVETIESCDDKIAFVRQHPELIRTYEGSKIVSASLYELVWQVPEGMPSLPHVHEKIVSDWRTMCRDNGQAIIDLYFLGHAEYQKGIMALFLRYHPDFKYADLEKLYSHYFFHDQNIGKPVSPADIIYASLRIKNGAHLFESPAGIMGDYTDKILKKGTEEIQKCIETGTEWCDIIRDFQQKLPGHRAILAIIETLLNQKCTLPQGHRINMVEGKITTDNDHRLLQITCVIYIPGPDGTPVRADVVFSPRG